MGQITTGKCAIMLAAALFCWMIPGPAVILLFQYAPVDSWIFWPYLAINIPHVVMFLSIIIIARIMKLRISALISVTGIRWKYLLFSGLIYLGTAVFSSLLSFRTISILDVPMAEKLMFLLPVLLITPMQTLSEEMVFRILPLRAIYCDELPREAINAIIPSIAAGFIFAVPHLGNPEVSLSASSVLTVFYYFLWGFLASFVSIVTGGFEAPVAMHAVNNLFAALIVNYTGSVIPTASLFINTGEISAVYSILCSLMAFALVLVVASVRGWLVPGVFRREDGKKKEEQ